MIGKVLLDTQTFILAATEESSQLSKRASRVFLDDDYTLYLSSASIWEMAIKIHLGKLRLPVSLRKSVQVATLEIGIRILPIETSHIYSLEGLPDHHRDPFDRLLIAQAIFEEMIVLGSDKMFDKYKVKRVW